MKKRQKTKRFAQVCVLAAAITLGSAWHVSGTQTDEAAYDVPEAVTTEEWESEAGTGKISAQRDSAITIAQNPEEVFTYQELDDGSIEITVFNGEQTGDLVIPGEIDGKEVTSIGSFAFYKCSGFTGELVLPNSLKTIGDGAFSDCSGFTGDLAMPKSLETIGNSAFYDCKGFTGKLELSDSLKTIGDQAFLGCGFTGELVLPADLETIGEYAFYDCKGFTGELVLPDSLKSIGNYTFYNCKGFTGGLVLPADLETIGEYAFCNCSGFTGKLELPDSLKIIEDGAFSGCGFTGELVLPADLETIGDGAFSGCSGFTGGLKLPESLTSIGDYAFSLCGFRDKLSLPKGIKLGKYAFFSSIAIVCENMTEFLVGESDILTVYGDGWEIDPDSPYPFVTWSSSDDSIAVVDDRGNVTALSPGGVSITATAYNGATSSIPLRVLATDEEGYDTIAPILRSVTFQESLVKPGVMEIGVNFIEENTGATSWSGTFQHVSDKSRTLEFYSNSWGELMFTGNHTCRMSVSTNERSGEYYLSSLSISDQNGNQSSYSYDSSDGKWYQWNFDNIYVSKINVNDGRNSVVIKDEFDVAFQSSVASPSVTEKLESMSDGSAAMLNFDGSNHAVKKEWFEAIKGTGKSLILSNDGIQWIFRGGDITDTKDIDCMVTLENTDWDNSESGLKLVFASNGILPGKATVRIKSDYIADMYHIRNTLYLYYVQNDQTLSLEDMPQYFLDGADSWCEFELTHNSTFVLSGKELDKYVGGGGSNAGTKKAQTIKAKDITKTYGAKAFSLGAKASGGGKLTYTVSDKKVATVSKTGRVTIKGCGVTKIKIKAAASKNHAAAAKTITLTVKPKQQKISSLKSQKAKTLTVKWKKDAKASGYILQYSTDKKFKKAVKTVTIKKNSTTAKTLSKLKGGKKYYVRVCSYKTSGGKSIKGAYSPAKAVTVKK